MPVRRRLFAGRYLRRGVRRFTTPAMLRRSRALSRFRSAARVIIRRRRGTMARNRFRSAVRTVIRRRIRPYLPMPPRGGMIAPP